MAVLVASALLLLGPTSAQASPDTTAKFTVTVIHAHNTKAGVDPQLRPLADYLHASFARFKAFDRLDAHTATVGIGKPMTATMPDGKRLELALRGVEKGFVKVRLELDGLKTTVDVRNGGLFFQAGRVYKKGILVLAIRAKAGATTGSGAVDTTGSPP